MKTYSDGWEYSKRQVIEYKESEKPDEIPSTDTTDAQEDMEKVIGMVCSKAAGTLEAAGIPGAPLCYRCKKSGRWKPAWEMPTRGRMPRPGELRTIDVHVKLLGYDRDSPEDIAARILTKVYDLERTETKEEAAHKAFWLGFDVAYATVYGFYKKKRSAGGKNSKRLSTIWAPILAEYMVNENAKITGERVYSRLIRLEDEGKTLTRDQWTFTVNTDGQIQAENQDGQIDTLELSSFEKRYLRPLRK